MPIITAVLPKGNRICVPVLCQKGINVWLLPEECGQWIFKNTRFQGYELCMFGLLSGLGFLRLMVLWSLTELSLIFYFLMWVTAYRLKNRLSCFSSISTPNYQFPIEIALRMSQPLQYVVFTNEVNFWLSISIFFIYEILVSTTNHVKVEVLVLTHMKNINIIQK